MTMTVAVALLAAVAFGLSLFVFAYLFNRFYGAEDTIDLALIMREINEAETLASAAMTQTKAAGAA
jgi:hypothetical protein